MTLRPDPRLDVHYLQTQDLPAMLAGHPNVLGVIGYGAGRPVALPAATPFIAAPLQPATGAPVFEIWTTQAPTRPFGFGRVTGACSPDFAFGSLELDEPAHASLEAAVQAAYLDIFGFLGHAGFAAPIRFWNYLTAITRDDRGLERYRRFNIGRHLAFSTHLRDPLPPVASGVGGHQGRSIIYFLAAHTPARPLENPRQVSAFAYPPLYGPRSPSFSRAALHIQAGTQTLFISGTASIVGHETRHSGNLPAQIAETMQNLRAVIAASGHAAQAGPGPGWALKIYLNDPASHQTVARAVDAMFGPDSRQLYLHGEICRPDLLMEIEAFCRLD